MPLEQLGENGYVATGNWVEIHNWLARKYACRLEDIGLQHSSGRSIIAFCKKELGLKRKATLEEIHTAIDAKIRTLIEEESK